MEYYDDECNYVDEKNIGTMMLNVIMLNKVPIILR